MKLSIIFLKTFLVVTIMLFFTTCEETGEEEKEQPAPKPQVSFRIEGEMKANSILSFISESEYVTTEEWNFGDGNESTGHVVNHQYSEAGTYTVVLTGTGYDGTKKSVSKSVTIETDEEPVNITAEFSVEGDLEVGSVITFIAKNTENIRKFEWSFGDGEKGEGASTTYSFKDAGEYIVILTITDKKGNIINSNPQILTITYEQVLECITHANADQFEFYNQYRDQISSFDVNTIEQNITIPIMAHVLQRNDGSGDFTKNDVSEAIDALNDTYSNNGLNINFLLYDTPNFIKNTNYYNNIDLISEENSFCKNYDIENVLNIYFTSSLSAVSKGVLPGNIAGRGHFPDDNIDRVLIIFRSSITGNTLAHEVGHNLSLFHTHETAFGVEYVDGSNCENAGDLLCDTPADPNLGGAASNCCSSSCTYTCNTTDSHGDIYKPMVTNIMSYNPNKECRTLFTEQQKQKILFTATNIKNYFKIPVIDNKNIVLSENINFGQVIINQQSTATLTITNTGNSTVSISSISCPSGFSGSYSGSIAAGQSKNVTITFKPVQAKTYSGEITVNSDAEGDNNISVSGTGVEPQNKQIELTGNLNFGQFTIGQQSTATLTISNTGNSSVYVSSVSCPSGFSGSYSGSIAAGQSKNVTITFKPVQAKVYSGTITVNSDAEGSNTIPVSGTGVEQKNQQIEITGDLDFGEIGINTSTAKTIKIENTGNQNVVINSISCPDGFSTMWTGTTLKPGYWENVLISFSPLVAKTYSGYVVINSDATGTNQIPASGIGIENVEMRIINVTGAMYFTNVPAGTSKSADLHIKNYGEYPLDVYSIDLPEGFSGNWNGTLQPGDKQIVSITFSPPAEGSYQGTLIVNTNAQYGSNSIPIIGYATEPEPVGDKISLSGDISFGEVYTGNSTSKMLSITNNDIFSVDITSINCPAGFSCDWTGNIAAKQTKQVAVYFSPTQAKSYSGTLTVKTTDEQQSVNVSGTGITQPEPTGNGRATFYMATQGYSWIDVTIDGGSTVYSLIYSFPTGSPSCGETFKAKTVYLSAGAHSYTADAHMGPTWTGTFVVTKDGCTLVPVKP